jgi:hypothetical protein
VIDVETRARRAGQAARAEAAARAPHLEVPVVGPDPAGRRLARPVVGVVTAGVALLLVVLVVGQFARPPAPVIDPAAPDIADLVTEPVAVDGVLPVPPVGGAIPAYLEDGTPVFVSHPEDGEVYVLVAFDGHTPGGVQEMVHWCPSSQQFSEARHGTRFNAFGDYVGGPAPRPLLDVPAEPLDDGRVRVTGPPGPARERTDVRAEVPMAGPECLGGEQQTEPTDDAVAHSRPTEVPQLHGSALPQGRWVWAEVRLGGPGGDARVCELDGRCPADAPRIAPGWGMQVMPDADELSLVLARGSGTSADLAVGADPGWSQLPAAESAPAALPIPDPGEAELAYLDDRTPVIVTHDAGEVRIVAAVTATGPDLVAWCPEPGFLADGAGRVWTLAGAAVTPDLADLPTYPYDVVADDEARALRVRGPATVGDRSAAAPRGAGSGDCRGDALEGHRPPPADRVARRLSPMVDTSGTPSWTWVETRLAEVDGQLVLCAYLGPDACGQPVPTDDTTADCYADLPTGGACADRDPTVATPGLAPTDEPVLLLVRFADDRATVEVHRPTG